MRQIPPIHSKTAARHRRKGGSTFSRRFEIFFFLFAFFLLLHIRGFFNPCRYPVSTAHRFLEVRQEFPGHVLVLTPHGSASWRAGEATRMQQPWQSCLRASGPPAQIRHPWGLRHLNLIIRLHSPYLPGTCNAEGSVLGPMKNRTKLHHVAETPLWWIGWGAEWLLLNGFSIWRSKAWRGERGCTAPGRLDLPAPMCRG